MELVELHVGELCAGLRSQSDAIAGGYGWVGRVRVDLACSTGGDEDGARVYASNAPFPGLKIETWGARMSLRIGAD